MIGFRFHLLQNGYLALTRQCLECVRYMPPVALDYPQGDCNGFRVYRPARGGRSSEHFGGYKTINRIPVPLPVYVALWTHLFHGWHALEKVIIGAQLCLM